jgi:TonB-dependent receptor
MPTSPTISKLLKTIMLASACFAALLVQSPAIAQTDQEADDSDALEEIVVVGIRSSLDTAAAIKRNSNQMVDAISAEDIGLFSDNNIGEALQRVPGVQLERDAGEGFRISIRGLGPRFVRTTVNGRTALSTAGGEDGSSEDSRGFTLNMIPSEVITRVTVEKSTMARNLEGGIGGTLDLQTNRPLSFADRKKEDFYISTAVRAGHNDLVDNESYRGSLFLNQKVNDNFGAFFGMVLDDTDRADHAIETEALRVRLPSDSGSNRIDFDDLEPGVVVNGEVYDQDDIDALAALGAGAGPNGEDAGISVLNAARNSSRDFDRARQTFTTGLQWQNDNFDVNFDWTYGHEENNQFLRRFAMSPGATARRDEDNITSMTIDFGDQDFNRTTPTIGTLTAFEFVGARGDERVNTENRYIPRTQDIHVGGLNMVWSNNDDWIIEADVGYAEQETERFDNQLGTQWNADDDDRDLRFEFMNGSYTTLGPGGYPVAYFEGVDADGNITPFDPTDLGHFFFRRAWRTLTYEKADDISARLDFTFSGDLSDYNLTFFDEVMFGVAWNERNGTRLKGRAREDEDDPTRGGQYADIDEDDLVSDLSGYLVQNYLPDVPGAVHDYVFLNHNDPIWDTQWAIPKHELLDQYLQLNQGFDVTERVAAAYLQLPFSGEGGLPYRGNIGLRWVHTQQTGEGYAEILDGAESRITRRTYDDVLPSFNVAFDLSDDVVLRFAGNKALTRPDPIDMTSYLNLGDFEDGEDEIGSGSGGNPDLQPYRTTSFDVSLEWYPEIGGSYALGLFHKDVDGWIARGRTDEVFTVPVIDGDGNVIEIRDEPYSIRRKVNTDGGTIQGAEFAFHLPFDSFADGFMEYFGINGNVTYVDAEMDAVVPENNLPISLRGTSEWSGNLVAYFEMDKFSARVAYNYRDDFLFQEAEDPFRHAEWTEGSEIIDVNLNYRFQKNMLLRLSANNLTGVTRERYWQTAGTNKFSDDRDNGQYYTLEFRYASD